MKLPSPPPEYDANNEAQTRRAIEAEDARNQKIANAPILPAPNGSRWKLVVDNAGVVSSVPA